MVANKNEVLRAGTESVHNIVGLKAALEIAYKNLEEEKNI